MMTTERKLKRLLKEAERKVVIDNFVSNLFTYDACMCVIS